MFNDTPIQKRKNFLEEMLARGEFDTQEPMPIIDHAPPQLIFPERKPIGGAGETPPIWQRDPYEVDPNSKPMTKPAIQPISKPVFQPIRKPIFQGRPRPRIQPNNPFFNAFMKSMF